MQNDLAGTISWLHFGDLHITTEDRQNYRDFVALVAEANDYVADTVDFAVLPGDNADDGTIEQYRSVARAIDGLRLPLEIRPGDHDRKSGTLEAYRQLLEPRLWRSRVIGEYRCLFLNSLDGRRKDAFDLGREQLAWFDDECEAAQRDSQRLVLFLHAYPSEHGASASALSAAIARLPVAVVDMGHTHYNELANDGHTIYAATRSTGQIEEGGVGFSITTIDRGVVSWKFHELERWPLVKITSPADRALIIDPGSREQVVRGDVEIRARVWGTADRVIVAARIDDGESMPMLRIADTNRYGVTWRSASVSDGTHTITVTASGPTGSADDAVTALCNQAGLYDAPSRSAIDCDNAIGAYATKGLLGTRLGPNANGRKW